MPNNRLNISSKNTVFNFLFFFTTKYKWDFLIIALCSTIVSVSTNSLWPYLLGRLTDGFAGLDVNSKDIKPLFPLMLMLIVYWIASVLIHSCKGFKLGALRPKYGADIRNTLFESVMHYKHTYFVHKHVGDISQRLSDLPRSANLICDNIFTVFGPLALSVIISSASFFYVHYIPSLMFMFFLITYLAGAIIMGKNATTHFDRSYQSFAKLFGCIVDSIRNHFNVRIFNGMKNEKSFIGVAQRDEIQKSKKAFFFVEKVKLALGLWEVLCVTSILSVSVWLWTQDQVTVGDLIFIANSIFNITTYMWFAIDEITYTFSEIGIVQQALTLLNDDDENSSHKRHLNDINITNGNIEFRDVTFQYKSNAKLFDSKSVHIKDREKIGLVGFSGSGKTTFVNLIMGLYELNGGEILIDGQDISKVSKASLRRNISFIQQDPILFHRSIMDNIRYGKLDASDEEVIDASIKAHAHDFIKSMPEGYNSTVGEMGTKLSGGQRQRIAIARAILRNAPILIMDEATSALDSITEKKIQESLNYLMQGKTVIVIAHRLSTVLHMDRIIVFDKGKITEEGNHEDLLKLNGYYKILWNMQHDGMLPEEKCED